MGSRFCCSRVSWLAAACWLDVYKRQHHDWTPLHPNNEETWRGVGMGVAMALACKEDLAGVDYVSLGMTEELKKYIHESATACLLYTSRCV